MRRLIPLLGLCAIACNRGAPPDVIMVEPQPPFQVQPAPRPQVQPLATVVAKWKEHTIPQMSVKVRLPGAVNVDAASSVQTRWGALPSVVVESAGDGVTVDVRKTAFDRGEAAQVNLEDFIETMHQFELQKKGTVGGSRGSYGRSYGSMQVASYTRDGRALSFGWVVAGRNLYTLRFSGDEATQPYQIANEWTASFDLLK